MSDVLRAHSKGELEQPEFAPFRSLFSPITKQEKRKNSINKRITRIGNGAFLYGFRGAYIRLFVAGKSTVNLRSMLRMLYYN
tara:strand:- start:450 stop:695 length:246 start_codon:yes stop_codon:yes gene_type:complete